MSESDSSEDVFALLGNDIRVGIIRVLGEEGDPLSFTEIHQRVGTRDTGQFNYHLDQLVNSFVERTEEGDYKLSYAGGRVVGAIYSGEFDRSIALDPFPLDSECVECSTQLETRYINETVYIRCPECNSDGKDIQLPEDEKLGVFEAKFWFPPGGVKERTPSELTCVFDQWIKNLYSVKLHGICDNCMGSMSVWLTDDAELMNPEDPVCIQFECDRCPEDALLSITSYLFLQPDVVGLYEEHGIDLKEIHAWNVRRFLDPSIEVTSKQPWEIEATFSIEDSHETFIIENDLTISKINT